MLKNAANLSLVFEDTDWSSVAEGQKALNAVITSLNEVGDSKKFVADLNDLYDFVEELYLTVNGSKVMRTYDNRQGILF